MSLADEWHDPQGPEPLSPKLGDAHFVVERIRQWRSEAIDESYEAAARAAGLDERTIALVLGRPTSQP